MPGDLTKGGRRGINWLAVRTYYFSSSTITHAECAKRFNISERSVERKSSSEHWRTLREQHMVEASDQLRDVAVDEIAEKIRAHGKASGGLLAITQKIVDNIERDGIASAKGEPVTSTMAQANVLLMLANAVARAVEVDRMVRGLKPGESSTADDETGDWTLRHRVEGITPAPEPKKA